MLRFRMVLSLHIILLAGSSSEESPKEENEILTCEKNLDPSFMLNINCGLFATDHRLNGFMLSHQWVLARADELQHCFKDVTWCKIEEGTEEQTSCKEVILHENYSFNDYNLGLLLTRETLLRWDLFLPWPEVRGFTDKCTELVVYSHDPKESKKNCTTARVVDCHESRNLTAKQIRSGRFLCAKGVFAYNNSFAVCDNVVVGIATGIFSTNEAVAFTKIEAHYSFIREKTDLKVPFEGDSEREKLKSTEESRSSTRRYGEELAEWPTKRRTTQDGGEWRRPEWEQRRFSGQHSRRSSGSGFKQSRVLLFLSVLVPLLLKLLCH